MADERIDDALEVLLPNRTRVVDIVLCDLLQKAALWKDNIPTAGASLEQMRAAYELELRGGPGLRTALADRIEQLFGFRALRARNKPEKRCATCKWYAPDSLARPEDGGRCLEPVRRVRDSQSGSLCDEAEVEGYYTCDAWEAKQENERKRSDVP